MKEKKQINFSQVSSVIENIIYYAILIPLVIVTLMIVYQQISNPDRIPDIFGFKMFMILDAKMDSSLKKGDLVFTQYINPSDLRIGDIIAFRNATNTITVHKIIDINQNTKLDTTTYEEITQRTFTMQTIESETNDTRYVKDTNVEGIVRNKLPYIGFIILFIGNPLYLSIIIAIIIIIGLISLFIAKKLDEKDEKKSFKSN